MVVVEQGLKQEKHVNHEELYFVACAIIHYPSKESVTEAIHLPPEQNGIHLI